MLLRTLSDLGEQVLVGNGSDELLAICLRACVEEGGKVAYTTPTYSLYSTLAEIALRTDEEAAEETKVAAVFDPNMSIPRPRPARVPNREMTTAACIMCLRRLSA